jgi:hypothetical protein
LAFQFKVFATAFPDGTHTIHDLIAEGDRVVVRVSGIGTHKGEFKGMATTGKPMEIAGMAICFVPYIFSRQAWPAPVLSQANQGVQRSVDSKLHQFHTRWAAPAMWTEARQHIVSG